MPSRPTTARSFTPAAVLLAAVIFALPAPAFAMSQDEKQIALAFFLVVAVVIGLALLAYYRIAVLRHQTLQAMVEKGMQIPAGLLDQAASPGRASRDQRRGILLVCAGVGIALFLLADSGPEEAMLGMIPALIGVGYLIVARLEARRGRDLDQPALP
jgi:hypothetical protein